MLRGHRVKGKRGIGHGQFPARRYPAVPIHPEVGERDGCPEQRRMNTVGHEITG
jgi:hypothetical protein